MTEETEAQKLSRALREFEPSWKQDGHGSRGAQPGQDAISALQAPVMDGLVRREPKQPEFPRDQSTGESTLDAVKANLYGAKNGEPYTFPVFLSDEPTPSTP